MKQTARNKITSKETNKRNDTKHSVLIDCCLGHGILKFQLLHLHNINISNFQLIV